MWNIEITHFKISVQKFLFGNWNFKVASGCNLQYKFLYLAFNILKILLFKVESA